MNIKDTHTYTLISMHSYTYTILYIYMYIVIERKGEREQVWGDGEKKMVKSEPK